MSRVALLSKLSPGRSDHSGKTIALVTPDSLVNGHVNSVGFCNLPSCPKTPKMLYGQSHFSYLKFPLRVSHEINKILGIKKNRIRQGNLLTREHGHNGTYR